MQVRSGVRAVPKRTAEGAPPLLGKIPKPSTPDVAQAEASGVSGQQGHCSWWLFTGLGVRGLLYHALMAEDLAAAVCADDEDMLDPVVRRWQTTDVTSAA
jgi:hypothetical protein